MKFGSSFCHIRKNYKFKLKYLPLLGNFFGLFFEKKIKKLDA